MIHGSRYLDPYLLKFINIFIIETKCGTYPSKEMLWHLLAFIGIC